MSPGKHLRSAILFNMQYTNNTIAVISKLYKIKEYETRRLSHLLNIQVSYVLLNYPFYPIIQYISLLKMNKK